MEFNSIIFVFLFFPASILLYYIFPKRFRNIPLAITGLVFYAWGNPVYIALLLFAVVFNYFAGLQMKTCGENEAWGLRRLAFVVSIVVDVAILVFFKYWDTAAAAFASWTGWKIAGSGLAAPLGVSFYTFTVLSYLADVYMGKAPAETNLLDFAVYVSFFPKISMGPIVRWNQMRDQLRERTVTSDDFADGMELFIKGLVKKVLLADNLGVAFSAIHGMTNMASATAWMGMIFYSLQLYFDFSGYSDMAIGMARLFGFKFDKNFDHPYCSGSISEFWRRWHISLGAWFREYIYIPLGGNRCSAARVAFNLLVVWVLTGVWHGSTLNFLCWGLFHGLFVMIERFIFRGALENIPKWVRVLPVCFIVFFGWVMFFSGSMQDALAYYGQMFGAGGMGFFDSTSAYYLTNNLFLLAAAVACASPFASWVRGRLVCGRVRAGAYITAAIYIVLFVVCIAYMLSSTYSTFLYAQF